MEEMMLLLAAVVTFVAAAATLFVWWSMHQQSAPTSVGAALTVEPESDAAPNAPKTSSGSHLNVKLKTKLQHPLLWKELGGHKDIITDVAFSADGKLVATCSTDRSIRITLMSSLASGAQQDVRLQMEFEHFSAVAFTEHSQRLVAALAGVPGRPLHFYALPNATQISTGPKPKLVKEFSTGHSLDVKAIHLMDVDKWMILCTSAIENDTEIKIFNPKGAAVQTICTNKMFNTCTAASVDNRFICVASYSSDVPVFEIRRSREGEFIEAKKAFSLCGHRNTVTGVCFNLQTTRAVTCSKDRTWRVWDITVRYNLDEDPRLVHSFDVPVSTDGVSEPQSIGIWQQVAVIIVGSDLFFCNVGSGQVIANVSRALSGRVRTMRVLQSRVAVLCEGAKKVQIWNFPPDR